MAFIKHQFWLGLVVDAKKGTTLGEQLSQAAQTSEKAEAKLEGPACPPECWHLWRLFLDLHATRTGTGFGGLQPITYAELDAYQRLTSQPLSPTEVQLLRAADLAACEQIAANQEQQKPAEPAATTPPA